MWHEVQEKMLQLGAYAGQQSVTIDVESLAHLMESQECAGTWRLDANYVCAGKFFPTRQT